jgi:nucleoid-associated protein YgaU
MESHSLVMKDDQDKAAKEADTARIKAEEAYNKAIPLLAKDTISAAEKSLEEATDAYAESLARNEYLRAQEGVKDANKKFEDKDFYNAYLKASAADGDARKARDIALGKKGVLGDSIADVNATIDRAKKYNAGTYAPENLKLAEDNVKIASDSLQALRLKQGFSAVEVAKMNADEALSKSMKGTSDAAISDAKLYLEKAEKSPGAAAAGTDLALARESLKSSQELNGRGKYDESITAASDSKRLSMIVINAKGKGGIDVSAAGKDKEQAQKDSNKSQSEIDRERGYSIYVVRYIPEHRDCLWRISKQYYGDGKKWPIIHEANKDLIHNPHLILPGWRLKIPLEGASQKKASSEKAPKSEAEGSDGAGRPQAEQPEF